MPRQQLLWAANLTKISNGRRDVAEDVRRGRTSDRAMRLRSISHRLPAVAVMIFVLLASSAQISPSWASDHSETVAEREDPDRGKHGGYLLEPKYYEKFVLTTSRVVASPFRWDAEHWAAAGLIVAGVGVMMLADEPFRDFWQDDVRGDTTDDFADFGDTVGDFYTLLPAVGVGFVAGAALDDRKLQAASLEAVQALAITAGFVKALKYGTGRRRPNDSPDSAFEFDGPGLSGDNKSFVSGHAAYSFTVASVFASAYDDNVYVAGLAYGLAGLSAMSRVNDDKHWLSDVVVGAAIGIILGKLVHHTSPFRPGPNQRVSVRPYHRSGETGVQLSLNF